MNKIYEIPGQNLGKLQKKIEALTRRAAKLGSPDVGMEILEGYEDIAHDGVVSRLYQVRVIGEAPCLNGWRFVAKLQHLGDGNVVRAVPGEDVPKRFRTVQPWCEHCNTRRRRKDTFVVAKGDEYKQVGSSCLADFTGHGSPDAAATAAEYLIQAAELCNEATGDDWLGDSGSGPYLLETEHYLAFAMAEIGRNGWTPRRVELWSSADCALVTMLDKDPNHDRPTEKDWQKAQDALAWVREELAGSEGLNDYEWNLVTACVDDVIVVDLIGIVASLIPTYERAMERKVEAEALAKSQYVGAVGERARFDDLTVIAVIPLPGRFGVTNLHKFLDRSGNVLVWFASNAELERGLVYGGKATVKAHSEYRGAMQTVLTRCKFAEAQQSQPQLLLS